MKPHLILLAVMLGCSLLVFPCRGEEEDSFKQRIEQEFQSSKKTFTGFSSLAFSYIDEYDEKKTITFYRNESVLDVLTQIQTKDFPEDMDPVEKRSFKKLRNALRLLYGKEVAQDTFRAIALLLDLAEVQKPYTPRNWKTGELKCHLVAKYVLALCYQDGVGVPKDLNKGLLLVKEACFFDYIIWNEKPFGWKNDFDDVAFPLAILEMSVRFLGGIDMNPNFIKGMFLLESVEDQGDSVAHGMQMKLEAIYESPEDLPEKFQKCETPVALLRAMEGFSALDISRMMARERTRRPKREVQPQVERRNPPATPVPSRPAPNVHVQRAMDQLLRFQKVLEASSKMAMDRLQNRQGDVAGFLGEIGDIRSVTESMALFARNLQTIDVSDCPPDFQVQFQYYAQCVANMVGVLAGLTHPENNGGNDIWEGFLGGLLVAGLAGEQVEKELINAREKLFEMATKKYGARLESN